MFSPTTKGILLKSLSLVLFTPIFAVGKIADGTLPALGLVAMRFTGGFLTLILFILITRPSLASLKSPKPSRHLVRACLGIGGVGFMIHATSVMPVANATAIGLTEGILIIALAGLLLNETITRIHWLAGGIALVGAGLVISQSIDLTGTGVGSWDGIIAASCAVLFMAFEALLIKFLSSREDPLRMLLYVNGFGCVIALSLVSMWLGWRTLFDPALLIYLWIGPLAIIGQYLNIKANQLVDVSILAPIIYSWILYATLLGLFMFDEVPTMITLLGSALIVAGGVVVSKIRS